MKFQAACAGAEIKDEQQPRYLTNEELAAMFRKRAKQSGGKSKTPRG